MASYELLAAQPAEDDEEDLKDLSGWSPEPSASTARRRSEWAATAPPWHRDSRSRKLVGAIVILSLLLVGTNLPWRQSLSALPTAQTTSSEPFLALEEGSRNLTELCPPTPPPVCPSLSPLEVTKTVQAPPIPPPTAPPKLPELGKRLLTRKEKVESLYGMGSNRGRKWLDHILSLDDEGLAPMTKFTQQYLHDHQNPPESSCAGAQYYVLNITDHGWGSIMHVLSFTLMNALDSSRILMWDDPAFGYPFIDPLCLTDGVRSLDCIMERLSSCSRTHLRGNNTVAGTRFKPPPGFGARDLNDVPRELRKELNKRMEFEFTPSALKLWWRGQAAAFFLRLNSAALEYISAKRLNQDVHEAFTSSPAFRTLAMPFPLHRGTVSMHIRHGDKAREMQLQTLETFTEKAEKLAQFNPHAYGKMAFISSEDPNVFVKARKLDHLSDSQTTSSMDWKWYTSKIKRVNEGPFQQLAEFGNRTETTLSWLSELMLALECDAFVGTMGSNWNRLIQELRCIWFDKCLQPYIEVGPEQDWEWYSW